MTLFDPAPLAGAAHHPGFVAGERLSVVNLEEVLLQLVRVPKLVVAPSPTREQQLLLVGQVSFPLQQHKAVVHKPTALLGRQRPPQALAYILQVGNVVLKDKAYRAFGHTNFFGNTRVSGVFFRGFISAAQADKKHLLAQLLASSLSPGLRSNIARVREGTRLAFLQGDQLSLVRHNRPARTQA